MQIGTRRRVNAPALTLRACCSDVGTILSGVQVVRAGGGLLKFGFDMGIIWF